MTIRRTSPFSDPENRNIACLTPLIPKKSTITSFPLDGVPLELIQDMHVELGEIIAQRSLTKEKNGQRSEILVLIGKPQQMDEGYLFITPYQLRGVGTENVRYAGGVDTIQSLQLALKMIGVELEALNNKPGIRVSWVAGEAGELGFPTT